MTKTIVSLLTITGLFLGMSFAFQEHKLASWQSKFVQVQKDGSLHYTPDEKGNTIPDFSRVGYYQGDVTIPEIPVVTTISPGENAFQQLQDAIDKLSKAPLQRNGFRGAILLKKGAYVFPQTLRINASGIVLRGEGDTDQGTKLVASYKTKEPLIKVSGEGNWQQTGERISITDKFVPVGTNSFTVQSASQFKPGDAIIVFRPGTPEWIAAIKMDQIEARQGTRQWKPAEYNLSFERKITAIKDNTIFIDNPVVMEMDAQYGGGEIYQYTFEGRIQHVGIEKLYCESVYERDTAENHAWDAIAFDKIENGWVRNVTARYFAYSCVNLGNTAKQITVSNSNCIDHKSVITGGRRYSFNNAGQLNLFIDCHTSDGRHDYVTGARNCGPNVFVRCTSQNTHADIGPHQRWAVGTLYDNIGTDGEINIQDRGNWGSGHGMAGVTQVVWNCTVKRAAVQNPWATGKNYCIGLKGEKFQGRFSGRPDSEWEGQNKAGLEPASLYFAQLAARKKKGAGK